MYQSFVWYIMLFCHSKLGFKKFSLSFFVFLRLAILQNYIFSPHMDTSESVNIAPILHLNRRQSTNAMKVIVTTLFMVPCGGMEHPAGSGTLMCLQLQWEYSFLVPEWRRKWMQDRKKRKPPRKKHKIVWLPLVLLGLQHYLSQLGKLLHLSLVLFCHNWCSFFKIR